MWYLSPPVILNYITWHLGLICALSTSLFYILPSLSCLPNSCVSFTITTTKSPSTFHVFFSCHETNASNKTSTKFLSLLQIFWYETYKELYHRNTPQRWAWCMKYIRNNYAAIVSESLDTMLFMQLIAFLHVHQTTNIVFVAYDSSSVISWSGT